MDRQKQIKDVSKIKEIHPGTLWCKVDVCGQTYEIRLVKDEHTKDIDGCEGVTISSKNLILIKDDLAEDRLNDTLIHELFVHALLEASGTSHVLREHLRLSEEQWETFEELFARMYTPALLTMLKNAKWISIPTKPNLQQDNAVKLKAAKRRNSRTRK